MLKLYLRINTLLCLCLFFSACTHWVKIHEKSTGAESFIPLKKDEQQHLPIAIIKDYEEKLNGDTIKPPRATIDHVVKKLRETNVFSSVLTEQQKDIDLSKTVYLSFIDLEKEDANPVVNATKGFCIGFTFFLLAPVVPFTYDFSSSMELRIVRWDGAIRQYKAKSVGTAYWTGGSFLAGIAGESARDKVTNNNINSIISQMISDSTFFMYE